MTPQEIQKDIEYAKGYLDRLHLLIPQENLLMECFLFPPFRWKTFYAQIGMENNKYLVHCAFPHLIDYFGNESSVVSFETVDALLRHPVVEGDVICKIVPLDNRFFDQLYNRALTHTEPCANAENAVVIDGVTAGVTLYQCGTPIREITIHPADGDTPLLESLLTLSDLI